MKIVKKFQTGGTVSVPAPAEQPAPSGDPMEQLIMAAQEAVSSQNPELAMQVCMMLLELVGAVPAPVSTPQGGGNAPVFKRGGKIARYTSPLDKFRK